MGTGYRFSRELFNHKADRAGKFRDLSPEPIDSAAGVAYTPSLRNIPDGEVAPWRAATAPLSIETVMKVRSSLKSLKSRHRDCKLVRRKGVVYIINKTDPRFKAKQG